MEDAQWSETIGRLRRTGAAQLQRLAVTGDRASVELSALLAALIRVRDAGSPDAVLELAPRELCAAGVFERVLLSRVRGSTWLPDALYAADAGSCIRRYGRTALQQWAGDLNIALASPLVEAEIVRRRLPALVQDAQDEPRTYRPLVQRSGSREYVVAPVVAGSTVIALIHADTPVGDRLLTTLDRDLIRVFADGVGLAFEHAELVQRVEHQRRHIAEAAQAAIRSTLTSSAVPVLEYRAAVLSDGVTAEPAPSPTGRTGETRDSSRLSRLTGREREVLALLASGATNAQLADQLTVAESTVKSHVKHILHKLGAGNRAAAIACYLRETRHDERWKR